GFGIDQILVVTFTRAAAAELRDRIRQKIQAAAEFLEGGPLPADDAWMAVFDEGAHRLRHRRALRLRDALHRFDEAVITTIHGFCQQALAQAGLRAAGDPGAQLVESDHDVVAEVCRDLLVRELADDPFRLSVDEKGRPIEWVDGKVKQADVANRQPHGPEKVERDVIAAVRTVL